MLVIDGRQGEGGGQVLRTSLSLAALTGRAFRLTHVRANRSRPGLRPQHLTAVRAVAALCDAELGGAELNATTLEFRPGRAPKGGEYRFDVADAAQGGSAGSVPLIAQALLWPLHFAASPARVTLRGGTHVPFSPPFHTLQHVARPAFARFGADFDLALHAWGWYPVGGGEMVVTTRPGSTLQPVQFERTRPGRIEGVAAVTNLPSHIPQRMARRAENLLRDAGLDARIQPLRETGKGPGAGIFLWLPQAGFSSLGRKGLPAEKVAEAAVAETLAFVDNETSAVDVHLADQLLIPMALAAGRSGYHTGRLTQHTFSNAALLRQWLDVPITIEGERDGPGRVTVDGVGFTK